MLSRIVRSVRNSLKNNPTRPTQGAPMLENLEKRELMAVSPIVAGTKIKGVNLSSGGVSRVLVA